MNPLILLCVWFTCLLSVVYPGSHSVYFWIPCGSMNSIFCFCFFPSSFFGSVCVRFFDCVLLLLVIFFFHLQNLQNNGIGKFFFLFTLSWNQNGTEFRKFIYTHTNLPRHDMIHTHTHTKFLIDCNDNEFRLESVVLSYFYTIYDIIIHNRRSNYLDQNGLDFFFSFISILFLMHLKNQFFFKKKISEKFFFPENFPTIAIKQEK